jgi:hypothetical protein
MVAHPFSRAAIIFGAGHCFHCQFGHRLGALSVSVNHASAASHSGPLGILS